MARIRIPVLVVASASLLIGCEGSAPPYEDGPNSETYRVFGGCPDDIPEGVGCIPVGGPPPDSLPPEEGGCWITGIGTFGKGVTRDSFGGNGMTMKDGRVRGQWQHTDHFDVSGSQKNGQNLFHGQVEYLRCKLFPTLNGPEVPKAVPNYAEWGGPGTFNHEEGYWFDVQAFDHAEGGIYRDRYKITVKDPDGNVVLEADGMGTHSIVNGPAGSMGVKGNAKAQTEVDNPTNTSCREDVDVTADLAWVSELGCLSGGNFQIHPPNKGHPYPPPPIGN